MEAMELTQEPERAMDDGLLDFEVKELDIKKDVGTGPLMADTQASAMSIVLITLV